MGQWRCGRLFIALCAVALRLISLPAAADDTSAITTFLKSPGVQLAVINAAAKSTVVVQNPCAAATNSVGTNVIIFRPVTFDEAGAPTGGAVKFPVMQQGCGADRLLNAIIFVQPDKKIGTGAMLPGTTRADPVLQKDGVLQAVTAAGKQEENCKIGYIANTEFISQESAPAVAGAKSGSWKELWTLISCTQKKLVPMQFIPDATGTTIVGGPMNAVKVLPLDAAK